MKKGRIVYMFFGQEKRLIIEFVENYCGDFQREDIH